MDNLFYTHVRVGRMRWLTARGRCRSWQVSMYPTLVARMPRLRRTADPCLARLGESSKFSVPRLALQHLYWQSAACAAQLHLRLWPSKRLQPCPILRFSSFPLPIYNARALLSIQLKDLIGYLPSPALTYPCPVPAHPVCRTFHAVP